MLFWHLALVLVTSALLHAKSTATVAMLALSMLAVVGVIQFFVWPTLGGSVQDGIFTSHWMYASLLLRGGTEALRGDGYPVRVHPVLGCLATVALLVIAAHEIHFTHMHAFHNWVHLLIYAIGAMLAFSTGADALAMRVAACCCVRGDEDERRARAASFVRSARKVSDVGGWCAMGLLLVGHVHDPAPLSVALHAAFGYFLMGLGAATFLCSLAHDVLPHDHPVCGSMRRVHALAWLLTGGITITMCLVRYATPSGAFQQYLTSRGIVPMSHFEEASVYLAATILACAVHVALLHLTSPAATLHAYPVTSPLKPSRQARVDEEAVPLRE